MTKKNPKWMYLLLVLALMLGLLTGCGPAQEPAAQETPEVINPDTFVEATPSSIETLDPHFMSSSATTCIAYNVFDSLLFNKSGSLEASLAMEVPSEENGLIVVDKDGTTHITFNIREGVTFHNGNTLVPEDVKYTFTRGILVGSLADLCQALLGTGSFANLVEKEGTEKAYQILDNAIAIEANKVTFHLPNPFSPFIDIIADGGSSYGIFSKAWCIEQGDWSGEYKDIEKFMTLTDENNVLHDKMIGTGPYAVTSWEPGEQLILESYDNYWQGSPSIHRIVRKIISDSNVAIQQLKQGDVDFVNLTTADLQQVEGAEGIQVVKDIPAAQLIKINFNFDIKSDKYLGNAQMGEGGAPSDLFSDIDVRKGLCWAFDYQTFINEVLLGDGQKPYGPVLIGYPTANPDNPQYEFDLEKATEHFKKAFDGKLWDKGFTLTVPYSEGSIHRQRALEILQANLQKINPKFKLELISLPWAAYVGAINDGEIPMSIFGILPTYRHPYGSLAYHMHSTGFYAGVEGYADLAKEKYDPLIEELARTYDEKRVQELSNELQRLSYEDALCIMHYQVIGQVALRDWIKGYQTKAYPFMVDYYELSKGY